MKIVKIGDYVKYKKVIWEVIGIHSDIIRISPRQGYEKEQEDIWIETKNVTKTKLSQLYFDL
jgi:hypothetical protein